MAVAVYYARGPITHPQFSNFYPCTVVYQHTVFQSSEQAFQWAKAVTIDDQRRMERVASAPASKRLGRLITVRPDWDRVKLQIMRDVLLCKFSQNSALATLILGTAGLPIRELAPWGDKFWGICNGVGQNQLGKALEWVRATLLAEQLLFG